MAITQRMDLRQAQSLVMTPQLQQAIKLLELSNQELAAYVEQELGAEPAPGTRRGRTRLTAEGGRSGRFASLEAMTSEPMAAPTPDRVMDSSEYVQSETMDDGRKSSQDPITTISTTPPRTAAASAAPAKVPCRRNRALPITGRATGSGGGRSDFSDSEFGLEQTLTRPETLREHLERQLYLDIQDPTERLDRHAADRSSRRSRLHRRRSPATCRAPGLQPGAGRSRPAARAAIRSLRGVLRAILPNAWRLQLKERNRLDPAMQALLDNLELLAKHDRHQLMKLCGIDAEDLADMVTEIRALNPKPGASFEQADVQAVVPDIMVWRRQDGSWSIELNSEQLPRLLVNQQYHARDPAQDPEQGREGLPQRASRHGQLAGEDTASARHHDPQSRQSEIVRQQEAFFLHGVQHLKPLIRRDIADAIGMHESTVSRVTTNKFMATQRGVFELRYFFTAAIQGADGQAAHSAEAVRQRIKELIDAEGAADILSG